MPRKASNQKSDCSTLKSTGMMADLLSRFHLGDFFIFFSLLLLGCLSVIPQSNHDNLQMDLRRG